MALPELFGPYEPINSLEAFLDDFDFGPETEFSTLTEMINFRGEPDKTGKL